MPTTTTLLAFAATSMLLIVVPGPSVLFVIGRSLALGRRGAVLSVAGNALGMLPLVAAVALGVGAVVAASATAFTVLKLLGGAYLVWLGVQAVRHRHEGLRAEAGDVRRPARALVAEGFVVGVTNPKTMAFFVAVLPQFADAQQGPVGPQLLVLGAVFAGLAFLSDGLWALAAGTARHWFADSPRRASGLAAAGGVSMIGLGGALLLSERS